MIPNVIRRCGLSKAHVDDITLILHRGNQLIPPEKESKTRENDDETRKDETRQDKTRQDKTRQTDGRDRTDEACAGLHV